MSSPFDITRFGAVGDGVHNDAAAIQSAIDAAHAAGGGKVTVPSGRTFLSGSLVLRSHVELYIERGATLQASGDWDDITEHQVVTALSSGTVRDDTVASGVFLAAYNSTKIAVTGAGVIDGAGRHYVLEDQGEIYAMPVARPFTLFFIDCEDVTLTDTTYRDGALWTVRLTGCESVRIAGIRIRNDMKLPNADGIDLDRCRLVRISDCDIQCPDDAISLKACEEYPDSGPCEDITITNCVLETRSSAVVIGVDATSPIRNVTVSNCVIRASHRGLSVNLGQDSLYENILFTNITIETQIYDDRWWGRGEPIYVSAYPWHEGLGTIRNVRFSHIVARSENGILISGFEPGHIDDIVFDDVTVELAKWGSFDGGFVDNRPYREESRPISHPTSAIRVHNATGVEFRNTRVRWADGVPDYFTHALELESADVTLDRFIGAAAHSDLDAVNDLGGSRLTEVARA